MTMKQYRTESSAFKRILIQTQALVIDAYREVNSKKLFWITLILSGAVVGIFALVGYDETGWSIGWKHFRSQIFNTIVLDKPTLYKNLFVKLGIYWWLTWLGIFLALASTAGVVPDFIGSGSIELYLTRPISRLRLFLTKYVSGLMFVAIQVVVFCIASFFVLGLRGGVWAPGVFLAVPLVVIFFSYLFCVCAFFGVLTRSTLAALLLTILFWVMMLGLYASSSFLMTLDISAKMEAEDVDRQITATQELLGGLDTRATTQPLNNFEQARKRQAEISLPKLRADRAAIDPKAYETWSVLMQRVMAVLPKTSQTYLLIERIVGRQIPLRGRHRDIDFDDDAGAEQPRGFFNNPQLQIRAGKEAEKQIRAQSATYVVGTSLLFELVVVAAAGWIFVRRDY